MNTQHRSNAPVVVVAPITFVPIGKLIVRLEPRGDPVKEVLKVSVVSDPSVSAACSVVDVNQQEGHDGDQKDNGPKSCTDLYLFLILVNTSIRTYKGLTPRLLDIIEPCS